MRFSARVFAFARFFSGLLVSAGIGLVLLFQTALPASAQSTQPVQPAPSIYQQPYSDYRQPLLDDNVPQNSHTYTQAIVIDVMAALMCNLVGIDPVNPQQQCLGINPVTNKLGYSQDPAEQQFGVQQESPQIGGALGTMANMVAVMYTPTVSSTQYSQYLASNFGIVKSANAQVAAQEDCSKNVTIGYGFCGLQPIFSLWVASRDFAYAILVIAFIFLGLGVMLRYKADSKTIMTIQNQIPRVIIAILLITFSYAIAGIMIDIMWTVTYAGVNAIGGASDARVRAGCTGQPTDTPEGQPLGEAATNNLLDNPFSFANRIYLRDCNGNIGIPGQVDPALVGQSIEPSDNGVVNIAGRISDSFILLMHSVINELLGWDDGGECASWTGGLQLEECLEDFGLWLADIIIILIIVVVLIIALFRLWFELIKAYVSFFIFVILGPIWIVFGLLPGTPLGFQKWLRLIFANLAAFPLVAFILVFARVVVEAIPPVDPAQQFQNSIFVPPLVGNPNGTAFGPLMALGAILIAPSIPAMIRERMGAGKNKFGPTIAAGIAAGAGVATAPAAKQWKRWNRYNSQGEPEGFLAKAGYNFRGRTPVGKFVRQRQAAWKQGYRNQQAGGTATSADFRRLQKYDTATGEKRQKLFNKSDQQVKDEMFNRDLRAAHNENDRRNGGSGSGGGGGTP
jgi:hypothetical protein